MEKISIIVPVYNAEKTIKRCVESLLGQSYRNIEVIIVNDGSTDKSYQLVSEYENLNKNVKVITQNNKGVSVARNKGLTQATGDYVMFIDSDDWLELETCQILIDEVKENTDLIIFGLNIYKNGKLLRTPYLKKADYNLFDSQNYYWELRKINLGPCNKLYKKINITESFNPTLSIGEDTQFVIDYLKNIKNVKVLEKCLYNVSLDNNHSLNRKYRKDKIDQLNIVRRHEEKFLYDNYGEVSHLLYNEYFLDLHAILYDVIERGLGFERFKKIIQRLNYTDVYSKAYFKRKYYKLFSFLAYNKKSGILYLILKFRFFIIKIMNKLNLLS